MLWCNNKDQLALIIKEALEGKPSNLGEAKHWLAKIAGENPAQASENAWDAIQKIIR